MDDHQDIARSSYADMLHDDERNHAYNMAIKANVLHLVNSTKLNPNKDRFFKCCDIGTGSGLLSMMIVRAFRDLKYEHFHVTSFEAFEPMAECAKKVIAANKMSSNITVIPGRSEDFAENPQFDLLVAELLDTELIGEGCLLTYRHAIQNLCSPSCVFIPKEAHIYIQLLDSADLWNRNYIRLNDRTFSKGSHVDWNNCPGLAEIDDMQLSWVDKKYSIKKISTPQKIFSFHFDDIQSLKLRDMTETNFLVDEDNRHIVVAMWWDIVMYEESFYAKYLESGENPYSFVVLSCAPEWHRRKEYGKRDQYIKQTYGRNVWREHWIQGIYYFRDVPQDQSSEESNLVTVKAYRDSHSLWFSRTSQESRHPATCTCGAHRILSRCELAFLASADMCNMLDAVKKADDKRDDAIFLDLNTCGAKDERLPAFEKGQKYRAVRMADAPHITQIDYGLQDEVCYAQVLKHLQTGSDAQPFTGLDIVCAQVCFTNLNRIRTRVDRCQGFDLTHLDELIEHSSRLSDASTESHHLIEYEFTPIDCEPPIQLMSVHAANPDQMATSFPHNKTIELTIPDGCDRKELKKGWALIFWANFYLLDGVLLTGGHEPKLGELKSENMQANCRQIVHFLHDHPALDDESSEKIELVVEISLDGVRVTG